MNLVGFLNSSKCRKRIIAIVIGIIISWTSKAFKAPFSLQKSVPLCFLLVVSSHKDGKKNLGKFLLNYLFDILWEQLKERLIKRSQLTCPINYTHPIKSQLKYCCLATVDERKIISIWGRKQTIGSILGFVPLPLLVPLWFMSPILPQNITKLSSGSLQESRRCVLR